MDDSISRQAVLDAPVKMVSEGLEWIPVYHIKELPSAEQAWTTEEVAEILANLTGDECACNYNGIDEWLPERCKYAESTCPNPKEKHGCWMQFLLQGGADMKGEQK